MPHEPERCLEPPVGRLAVGYVRDQQGELAATVLDAAADRLEIAGAGRFASDAKLARAAGLAPIPISSGKTSRQRLDRGGNRQINAAIRRIAVTRASCHPETQDYIARKLSEDKTHRDAVRSLKRHLARRVWHLLQPSAPIQTNTHDSIDIGAAKRAAPRAGFRRFSGAVGE